MLETMIFREIRYNENNEQLLKENLKKIAENIDNPKVVKSVYWNVTFIKLLLSVVSLLFVFIFVLLVPKISQHLDGILYSYIMVLGTVFFPIWWFQGNNKMRELSIVSAVSKIVSYPLIFVFVLLFFS